MTACVAPPDEIALAPDPDGLDSRLPVQDSAARFLLLEDDAEFREIIRDFLMESGAVVVTARNGVEGVRELMAGEFTAILCDVLMPKLPGDMFYRAVEGIRPQLCPRFVFMTGHRFDEKTNAFIREVNGTVLTKPFPMDELERTIARIREVRPAGDGIASPPPAAHSVERPAMEAPAAGQEGGRWRPILRACAWLGFAAVLAAVPAGRFFALRERTAERADALRATEMRWTTISAQLQEAVAVRPKSEAALGRPARVAADRAKPRWTPALHAIALAARKEIELLDIDARAVAEDPGACEVRISGEAGGSQPRQAADRFREAVEGSLWRSADGRPVSTRFERLEDVPDAPGALPDQHRADFTIVVVVGSANASATMSKEGR